MAAAVVLAKVAFSAFLTTVGSSLGLYMANKLTNKGEDLSASATITEDDIAAITADVDEKWKERFEAELRRLKEEQEQERAQYSHTIAELQESLRQRKVSSWQELDSQDSEMKVAVLELARNTKPTQFVKRRNIGVFGKVSSGQHRLSCTHTASIPPSLFCTPCADLSTAVCLCPLTPCTPCDAIGKSSMVNQLVGQKVATVGYDGTTKEICGYPLDDQTAVFDVPGCTDLLSYLTYDYIKLIKGLDLRIILVERTVDDNVNLCRILEELQLSYIIAVNKNDEIAKEEDADGIRARLRAEIDDRCQGKLDVLFVSAKDRRNGDWAQLLDYVVGDDTAASPEGMTSP
jgi:GTP-binding protein EngB required for normal cell division